MKSLKSKVSKKNPAYISKHRYLELKHLCLQYDDLRKELENLAYISSKSVIEVDSDLQVEFNNPVYDIVSRKEYCEKRIYLIEECCNKAGGEVSAYIFLAVTKGVSFEHLSSLTRVPCGRRQFYEKYRKFFSLLSQKIQLL